MNNPPKKSPQNPPQKAPREKADDLFFRVVAFADDAEMFHIESSRGQALHRLFRLFVGGINGHRCLIFFHGSLLRTEAARAKARRV